jgi:hypothetical protein
MRALAVVLLAGLALTGCSKSMPTAPVSDLLSTDVAIASTSARTAPGRPGYEPAYVDGKVVTINAILTPPRASERAQADFYLVVYPIGFENLGIGTPQCDPCDHFGDGIDFTDFHDHVLDSMPGASGGEFSPLWHVFAVVPAYNGQAEHDAQVTAAYAGHIPTRSEAKVNDLLASRLPDGSPVAVKVDKNFYFICSVVSPNAAP